MLAKPGAAANHPQIREFISEVCSSYVVNSQLQINNLHQHSPINDTAYVNLTWTQ